MLARLLACHLHQQSTSTLTLLFDSLLLSDISAPPSARRYSPPQLQKEEAPREALASLHAVKLPD